MGRENNALVIYEITTEADCEGRRMKRLGLILATSEKEAAAEAYAQGYKAYYAYTVREIAPYDGLVIAKSIDKYNDLEITSQGFHSYKVDKSNNAYLTEQRRNLERLGYSENSILRILDVLSESLK